jgi:hypothetical protein
MTDNRLAALDPLLPYSKMVVPIFVTRRAASYR